MNGLIMYGYATGIGMDPKGGMPRPPGGPGGPRRPVRPFLPFGPAGPRTPGGPRPRAESKVWKLGDGAGAGAAASAQTKTRSLLADASITLLDTASMFVPAMSRRHLRNYRLRSITWHANQRDRIAETWHKAPATVRHAQARLQHVSLPFVPSVANQYHSQGSTFNLLQFTSQQAIQRCAMALAVAVKL